jgi:hypothetical protein
MVLQGECQVYLIWNYKIDISKILLQKFGALLKWIGELEHTPGGGYGTIRLIVYRMNKV